MERLWIFLILFLLIIVIVYFGFYSYKPKVKILSNITELYSLFTPYMEETVNSNLKLIDCEPNKYYYNDSAVCFVCNDMNACFGYGWVNRAEGEKMNPMGLPYLSEECDINTKMSFYSDGFSKLLSCRCDKECVCEDNIKARLKDEEIILTFPGNITQKQKSREVIFTFPENINIKQKIEQITKKVGIGECNFTDRNTEQLEREMQEAGITGCKLIDTYFVCGNLGGFILTSNEVVIER